MSRLAFDCCRCVGVSTDEGELVNPCNTCRRVLWAQPSGPRSPWFIEPPRDAKGECASHWPTEDSNGREKAHEPSF